MSTLIEDAMTETYVDVERLIKHTVSHFIKRHGTSWGTFDELFSHANESFMVAWHGYKPERGASFSTWCRWVVSKNLSEHQRTAIYRSRKAQIDYCDMTEIHVADNTNYANVIDIFDELDDDAGFVAHLTLNPPQALEPYLAKKKGHSARNQRAVIRQYLYDMEWSAKRIDKAFKKIGEALA